MRSNDTGKVVQLCLEKLVSHSPLRKLFIFLIQHNPEIIEPLKSHPNSISIRVSFAHTSTLNQILNNIEPSICKGINLQNTLINGGLTAGCIRSVDPEPHTTFNLILGDSFFSKLRL